MMYGEVGQEFGDVAHVMQPELPLDGLPPDLHGKTAELRDYASTPDCYLHYLRSPQQPLGLVPGDRRRGTR